MTFGDSPVTSEVSGNVRAIIRIVSLVLAPGAEREIHDSQGRLGGLGQVRAGKICSWITIGITVLGLVIGAIFLVIGLSSHNSSSYSY